MARCNPTTLNCSPEDIMAATAIPGCSVLIDPSVLQAEQIIYDKSYDELINNFGIEIDYYINTFNLSGANLLYGEHPTSIFYGPITMMMYIELNDSNLSLSKYGFDPGDDLTGFVHIRSFTQTISNYSFYVLDNNNNIITLSDGSNLLGTDQRVLLNYLATNQVIEPKSGDLIDMIALGCTRPGDRGSNIYEITERRDQDIDGNLNPLMGHYVYKLTAKRFEYSFEPNAPQERGNEQIYENSFSGKLSTNISDEFYADKASNLKQTLGDIDVASKENVFDMDKNNTDIYGSYYGS